MKAASVFKGLPMSLKPVAAAFAALFLAGCGYLADIERQKVMKEAREAFSEAVNACQTSFPEGKDTMNRARCFNSATVHIRATMPFPDLLDQENAARLSIAEDEAKGKITRAEAAMRFTRIHSDMVAEEQRRMLAGRSVSAQESAAAAAWRASSPVSCTKTGNTVNCF